MSVVSDVVFIHQHPLHTTISQGKTKPAYVCMMMTEIISHDDHDADDDDDTTQRDLCEASTEAIRVSESERVSERETMEGVSCRLAGGRRLPQTTVALGTRWRLEDGGGGARQAQV